jgi:hypothetical protein
MATITPQSSSGTVTYTAASGGGDTVALGSATNAPRILVRNASGSSITVTLAAVNPCNAGVLHNQVATCPVGDSAIVPNAFVVDIGNPTAANKGNVGVTYSATTSITVAAVAS